MQVPFGFVMNLYWIFVLHPCCIRVAFVLHVLYFGVKYGAEFSNMTVSKA